MIVPKTKIENTFQPDLTQVPNGYEVEGSRLNSDGETYTLTLRWVGNCPEQASNWKLTAVLTSLGYTDEIEAMLEEYSPIVQQAWKEAPTIRRASPMILEFADRLELTDEEVDALFVEAEKIEI